MISIHYNEIKSIYEVSGFRLKDKKAEDSLNEYYKKYDGYLKCKIFVLNPNEVIGEEINIVLIFDKDFKIANELDNTLDGIETFAYKEFRKNYLSINTLIFWK